MSLFRKPVRRFECELLEDRLAFAGDFNLDGSYDCRDIDQLVEEIAGGYNGKHYDMNGDGSVNYRDITDPDSGWLLETGRVRSRDTGRNPILPGDANLDGTVDAMDFGRWVANKFTKQTGWCQGDFNADGSIDAIDFAILNSNLFTSSGLLVSRGLARSAYSSSNYTENAYLAFDGNPNSVWGSGGWPEQWIEVELPHGYLASYLTLVPEQLPPDTRTVHEVWVSRSPMHDDRRLATQVATHDDVTSTGVQFDIAISEPTIGRFLQIRTTGSESWVAWRDIRVFASQEQFELRLSRLETQRSCVSYQFCFETITDAISTKLELTRGDVSEWTFGLSASANMYFDVSAIPRFNIATASLKIWGIWSVPDGSLDSVFVDGITWDTEGQWALVACVEPINYNDDEEDEIEVHIQYDDPDGIDNLGFLSFDVFVLNVSR